MVYNNSLFANNSVKKLSHSGIEVMYRCPRCFWLRYNEGLYQPEGIQSRLANRFDAVMKRYFNLFRGSGKLPPIVQGQIQGKLESPFQEEYSYQYNDKYALAGKLDECLVREDGKYIPVDHKTSSSDPRGKEALDAYGHQLNAYALLLEENKKPTAGFGYLIYYYPDHGDEIDKGLPLVVHVEKVKTDPAEARKELEEAVKILEDEMPEASPTCEFCTWYEKLKKLKL